VTDVAQAPIPAPPPRWLRVLRNPVVRIVLFVLMMFGFGRLLGLLLPPSGLSIDQAMALGGWPLLRGAVRSLVPVCLAYWLLVRVVEGRRVAELTPRRALPMAGLGGLVGFALMLLAAGLMAAVGAYRVQGIHHGIDLVAPLVVLGIVPGITEEIVFRGVLFRVVEDGLGTWIALVVSGLLFGLAHLANPNATVWSSLAIAIEAGLLLGMAYAWTRSLWFCMGLHAAWNFTQGPLLGITVSGVGLKGWLQASTQGPTLLSGGEFGAEASLLTVLLCLALAAYFIRRALAAGNIRPPFWRLTRRDPTG
jgi:hypothetical protein